MTPLIIPALFQYEPDRTIEKVDGFMVHTLSEHLHRDGLRYMPKYDKGMDAFKGIKIRDYPEWIPYNEWLFIIDNSVHYFILPDGTIEIGQTNEKIAYHAGPSSWKDWNWLNGNFLSAEIIMPGKNTYGDLLRRMKTEVWFSPEQIDSLVWLINYEQDRCGFDKSNIIGHSQASPVRKEDPGIMFPMAEVISRV